MKTFDDFLVDDDYPLTMIGKTYGNENIPDKTYIRCFPNAPGEEKKAKEFVIYADIDFYNQLTKFLPPKHTGEIKTFRYKGINLSIIFIDAYFLRKEDN